MVCSIVTAVLLDIEKWITRELVQVFVGVYAGFYVGSWWVNRRFKKRQRRESGE